MSQMLYILKGMVEMKTIQIYPKYELLNTWAIDRTRFTPDATKPPLCLRCGKPLSPVLAYNALSRYADVHICDACGTDEAIRDAMCMPMRLVEWDAVKQQRLKIPAYEDIWVLTPRCSFYPIYLNTSEDNMGRKSPVTELAYSRSDYDGRKWWTTWFTAHEELKTPDRIKEIDQFMEALFQMPEMASLNTMRRMCRVYAEPTSEATEANLYCETERFHVWLRLITRERDYNLYVHFYVSEGYPESKM